MVKKLKRTTNIHFHQLGHLFFLLGIALVLIFTFTNQPGMLESWHSIILILIGLIVGLMDLKPEHTTQFLLAFLGLLITANAPFYVLTYYKIGNYLQAFLLNMSIFLSLTVVVVSLRVLYRIYKGSNI